MDKGVVVWMKGRVASPGRVKVPWMVWGLLLSYRIHHVFPPLCFSPIQVSKCLERHWNVWGGSGLTCNSWLFTAPFPFALRREASSSAMHLHPAAAAVT